MLKPTLFCKLFTLFGRFNNSVIALLVLSDSCFVLAAFSLLPPSLPAALFGLYSRNYSLFLLPRFSGCNETVVVQLFQLKAWQMDAMFRLSRFLAAFYLCILIFTHLYFRLEGITVFPRHFTVQVSRLQCIADF